MIDALSKTKGPESSSSGRRVGAAPIELAGNKPKNDAITRFLEGS
jgi:hypothetical protein